MLLIFAPNRYLFIKFHDSSTFYLDNNDNIIIIIDTMTYPYPSNSNSKNKTMKPYDLNNHNYDHNDLSETEFLKNSIVTHTKYGSTNSGINQQDNYRFLTHYIESTDTLQGLALKYGCKIENIKKFNKLYSNDNNHLRSRFSILIPIESKTKIQFHSDFSSSQSSSSSLHTCANNNINNNQHNSTNDQSLIRDYDHHHPVISNSHSIDKNILEYNNSTFKSFDNVQLNDHNNKRDNFKQNNKSNSLTSDITTASHNNQLNDESVADFLIRIDSSIARTKNQIENFNKRNNINEKYENDNIFKFNTPSRISSSSFNTIRNSTNNNSERNIFDQHYDLMPKVKTTSHNKKIKSSLKRLEKSQEEIFEL